MIQPQAGQTFEINDALIADFPWYELIDVTRCLLEFPEQACPAVYLTVAFASRTELIACFQLKQVTECRLPAVGIRRLQFSCMSLENVRAQQWEDVNYKLYDDDFGEPSLLFKSGTIRIQAVPQITEIDES